MAEEKRQDWLTPEQAQFKTDEEKYYRSPVTDPGSPPIEELRFSPPPVTPDLPGGTPDISFSPRGTPDGDTQSTYQRTVDAGSTPASPGLTAASLLEGYNTDLYIPEKSLSCVSDASLSSPPAEEAVAEPAPEPVPEPKSKKRSRSSTGGSGPAPETEPEPKSKQVSLRELLQLGGGELVALTNQTPLTPDEQKFVDSEISKLGEQTKSTVEPRHSSSAGKKKTPVFCQTACGLGCLGCCHKKQPSSHPPPPCQVNKKEDKVSTKLSP